MVKSHKEECIVYLDSYKIRDNGVLDAYIDFRLEKDYELFRKRLNLSEQSATFIELKSMKSAKRLFQGCYYCLNLSLLKSFEYSKREGSLLVGGSYDLCEMSMPDGDDDEILQQHELLDSEELRMRILPPKSTFNLDLSEDIELFVKDVGQANWNELRVGGKVEVLFDAGADLNAPAHTVYNIFDTRRSDLERDKPVLVISHWDKDHIHCLKLLGVLDIKKYFSILVCVDKLKSITSSRLFSLFEIALGKHNVYCLPVPGRTNGIDMHLWLRSGGVSFYQGENSRNINYCGLVMFVRGRKASGIYTGDCRLSQAKNVYQQEMNLSEDPSEHVLIAPHHGGDYGARHRSYLKPCNEIIISVGSRNIYGHPQKDMLKYLRTLGIVTRTDNKGDVVKEL